MITSMKKQILLLGVLLLWLSACTINESTESASVQHRVAARDWVQNTDGDGLNLFFSCTMPVPELSNYVFQHGLVQVYIVLNGAQQVLPYSRHYEDLDGNYWTQTIDYEFSQGSITYFVTHSDFFYTTADISTMDFRVQLWW